MELILSALLVKAVALCLHATEMCLYRFRSSPILISLFAFMSQVHYFVIIINQKSQMLSGVRL